MLTIGNRWSEWLARSMEFKRGGRRRPLISCIPPVLHRQLPRFAVLPVDFGVRLGIADERVWSSLPMAIDCSLARNVDEPSYRRLDDEEATRAVRCFLHPNRPIQRQRREHAPQFDLRQTGRRGGEAAQRGRQHGESAQGGNEFNHGFSYTAPPPFPSYTSGHSTFSTSQRRRLSFTSTPGGRSASLVRNA